MTFVVDDIIFCNSFIFNNYHFMNYKYTDKTEGIPIHYFAYMTKGNAKICTRDETVYINQGDLFYIPNGCKYRSYWYGDPEIEFISLGFRFMPNFQNKHYEPQVIERDEDAIKAIKEIVEYGTLDGIAIGKFYTLVGALHKKLQHRSVDKDADLIEKVKGLLAEHPDYTVKDIAKACAVSESTLYSAFRKNSDTSMHDVKKSVVMEAAKDLLVSTDHPVEEISRRLNFSSSVYFRKCFKEHFGVSPRQMRKAGGI